MSLVVLLGGARSGKSALAVDAGRRAGDVRRDRDARRRGDGDADRAASRRAAGRVVDGRGAARAAQGAGGRGAGRGSRRRLPVALGLEPDRSGVERRRDRGGGGGRRVGGGRSAGADDRSVERGGPRNRAGVPRSAGATGTCSAASTRCGRPRPTAPCSLSPGDRLSSNVSDAARAALDAKTKPRGSLGRLEELAVRVAAIRGDANPGAAARGDRPRRRRSRGRRAWGQRLSTRGDAPDARQLRGGGCCGLRARAPGRRGAAGLRPRRGNADRGHCGRARDVARAGGRNAWRAATRSRQSSRRRGSGSSRSARWGSATRPRLRRLSRRCSGWSPPRSWGEGPAWTTRVSRERWPSSPWRST